MLNIISSGGKLKLAISRDTNGAVSKNYSSPSSSGTVSAVKASKPFQSCTTSPSCYPSPLRCMSLPILWPYKSQRKATNKERLKTRKNGGERKRGGGRQRGVEQRGERGKTERTRRKGGGDSNRGRPGDLE